jgi:hypothetical protein
MKQPHQMHLGNRYARGNDGRRTLADLMQRKIALVAVCRRCKHRRLLLPGQLAGREETLTIADLRRRLRCSQCSGYGTANLHEATR